MENDDSDNIEIRRLTKEFAESYSNELLVIHNMIPYQRWNKYDLLSVSDHYREYKGKWKYSRVCLVSGIVVGLCIAFEMNWGLYIHRLAVVDSWQAKYIGTRLVYSVVSEYANTYNQEGLVRVQTPVEKLHDEGAIVFYEKIGFAQCGRKKYENKEDYLLEGKAYMILKSCKKRIS